MLKAEHGVGQSRQTEHDYFFCTCSKGLQRFEGIVQNLNGVLMFEEWNMRVLADAQQARKLMEPFLLAASLPDLFDEASLRLEKLFCCCAHLHLACRVPLYNPACTACTYG